MGLHWAWPSFQSLVPEAIFDRIQTTQVDPSMPVKSIERLLLLNGATGELLTATPVDRFYRLRRSKTRALLMEGLDVQTGKDLAGIAYSSDGRTVTASFEEGTSTTGCLLSGTDGPHSTVRQLLVGAGKAKVVPIDYAATCASASTRATTLSTSAPCPSTPYSNAHRTQPATSPGWACTMSRTLKAPKPGRSSTTSPSPSLATNRHLERRPSASRTRSPSQSSSRTRSGVSLSRCLMIPRLLGMASCSTGILWLLDIAGRTRVVALPLLVMRRIR